MTPPFPFVSPSFKKRNVKIKDSNIIYFPSDTIKEFKISKILSSTLVSRSKRFWSTDQEKQNFKIATSRKTRTWNIYHFFDRKYRKKYFSYSTLLDRSLFPRFPGQTWFRTSDTLVSACSTFAKRYSIQKQSVREIGSESGRTHGRADRRWNELLVRRPGGPPCNSLLINRLISNLGIRRISALPCSLASHLLCVVIGMRLWSP